MSREANNPDRWDELWSKPEHTDWRAPVMAPIYDRICRLMPASSRVVDIGGGIGTLAKRLHDDGHEVEVWDHSEAAIAACRTNGLRARRVDLEHIAQGVPAPLLFDEAIGGVNRKSLIDDSVVIATEVLEHLSEEALYTWMLALGRHVDEGGVEHGAKAAFFSVPNDRLGPDEEAQHARKWTALSFKRFLQRFFTHVRVEVLGPPAHLPRDQFPSDRGQPCYLLGIVGFPKAQTISMCMPARDEAADIEKTLASFMGFADEIVVGIDPRTKDNTRELAEKYADIVFDLTELLGPPGEEVPEGGFHFAHARNQCMARCSGDWIFMTEAHEPLWKGQDTLLHLDSVPADADVLSVMRTGGKAPTRQQWLFPWICRNRKGFRYVRSTHNTLEYGDAPMVIVPSIKTLHERVHERDVARQAQRAVQNRQKLTEDWLANHNEWSLHYLGAEWREFDREKAIDYLHRYIEIGSSGALRYHTRLVLAKELVRAGRPAEARDILHEATADDWSRNEHWIFLGDLAFEEEKYAEAAIFFEYAATMRKPPLTAWWIDLAVYSWIPTQRLAMTYSALGRIDEALTKAQQLLTDYDEAEAPEAFVREAEENIRLIEEALASRDVRRSEGAAKCA